MRPKLIVAHSLNIARWTIDPLYLPADNPAAPLE